MKRVPDAPSGRECYAVIAEELGDHRTTLADLDDVVVERAKGYAKRCHKKWPPKGRSSWQVQWRAF